MCRSDVRLSCCPGCLASIHRPIRVARFRLDSCARSLRGDSRRGRSAARLLCGLSGVPGSGIGDQPGQDAPPASPALAGPGGNLAPAAAAEAGGDAAAAGAGRLPGRVQARQRGEGAAVGAGAGAQPGLQVAVLADSPLRPAIGAAGVALPSAHRAGTGREPGGNRAGSGWRRRGRGMPGCYSSSRMRARSDRRPGLSSATAAADSPAVLRRADSA